MKSLLLAGAAVILLAGGASAQIQSPSQTGPGGPPMTGTARSGDMGMGNDARSTRSMTAQSGSMSRSDMRTQRPAQRTSERRRSTRPEDQAYMGGGMILENGRPVQFGSAPMGGTMMSDRGMGGRGNFSNDMGVGPGMGRPIDPTGMGTAMMPGGTGTGRGSGSSASGGGN